FKDRMEALLAYEHGKIGLQQPILVRLDGFSEYVEEQGAEPKPMPKDGRIVTTAGRILFSDILSPGMAFYNCALGKKGCARVIDDVYAINGRPATIDLLDRMKEIGFKQSTLAGLSFGVTDMR